MVLDFGSCDNSPRLPAEKRLEQADPDRASFPLTQPFPIPNFLTPPPPPPALWDPPQSLGGAANRCRGGSRLSVAPTGKCLKNSPQPHPPLSSWGRPGCRGGARKRLQLCSRFQPMPCIWSEFFGSTATQRRLPASAKLFTPNFLFPGLCNVHFRLG